MKKIPALLVALVLVFAMMGIASAEADKARVAFICKGYQDTYCLLVMNIFDKYVAENYADLYTVDHFDGEPDSDKLNGLLETCTVSGYDVIVLQQEDPDAQAPYVQAPLLPAYRLSSPSARSTTTARAFYRFDPSSRARLWPNTASTRVCEGRHQGCHPAGPCRSVPFERRTEGYLNMIEKVGADLVAQEICAWQMSNAQTCVDNWLVAYPDLEVILSCNDDMALGAIEAMKLAGNDRVYVVGVDANEEGCLALKDGTLKATVAQDTFSYAYDAADYAAKLIKGETVESKMCDSVLITPDMADENLMIVHGYTQEQIDALNS